MTPNTRLITFINAGAHLHALFAADPADRGARHGGAGRAVRRFLCADPGARDRDVRAVRAVLAAAGLDRATHRAAGADDVFFLGTGLSMAATAFAGSPAMLALGLARHRAVRRDLPPDRHRHAGGRRGRQPGRAIGINGVFGNFGVALAPVMTAFLAHQAGWRAAFLLPGVACAALGLAVDARAVAGGRDPALGRGRSRRSPAISCAARWWCCC